MQCRKGVTAAKTQPKECGGRQEDAARKQARGRGGRDAIERRRMAEAGLASKCRSFKLVPLLCSDRAGQGHFLASQTRRDDTAKQSKAQPGTHAGPGPAPCFPSLHVVRCVLTRLTSTFPNCTANQTHGARRRQQRERRGRLPAISGPGRSTGMYSGRARD